MDIISLICKAYKGSKTPQACLGLSLPVTKHKDTDNTLDNVCYKEEKSKSKSRVSEIMSATEASWMHDVGMVESM